MNPKLLLTISAGMIFALAVTMSINQEPVEQEKPSISKEMEKELFRPLDQASMDKVIVKSGRYTLGTRSGSGLLT